MDLYKNEGTQGLEDGSVRRISRARTTLSTPVGDGGKILWRRGVRVCCRAGLGQQTTGKNKWLQKKERKSCIFIVFWLSG